MNTISVNQTEENLQTSFTFESIVQENKKTLFDKINHLKISEDNKEKILLYIEDCYSTLLDKYHEDLEFFNYLKHLNKDLIFLESIKKVLVDKLILSSDDSNKYEEIEKSISKIEDKKTSINNKIKEILTRNKIKKERILMNSLMKDTETLFN